MAEFIILPALPQFHSRVFANRKAAGRAVVLMWLFLEMSSEQNRAGSRNGTRQRRVLGVPPVPSLPGSLATFQEITQLNEKSSFSSLQSALLWVFSTTNRFSAALLSPSSGGDVGTGTSMLLGWGQELYSSSRHPHSKILPSLLLRRTPKREKEELLTNLQLR